MEYTVKALAELSGVTARTLRWYDQKGLLKPLRVSDAGYRIYGPEQVDRLQLILFYRALGLELSAIRSILDDPGFDRLAALQSHLAELVGRREQLEKLILTVRKTIEEAKGGTAMSGLQAAYSRSKRARLRCGDSRTIRRHRGRPGQCVRPLSDPGRIRPVEIFGR